jgi:phosphomannomutase
MQVNPSIFKAYDIRGVYPTDLSDAIAYALGRAFVTLLQAPTVIVGRDMRLSGPALTEAVTAGLLDQGAEVVDIGMVGTDQFYFACAQLKHPGLMVTASHNPKAYNGFKLVRRMPYLLSGADGIQELRQIIETETFVPKPAERGKARALDLSEQFVETVLGIVEVPAIRPLKVIVDTGNGMVGPILQRLYARLPVKLIGMYLEPDGHLPHHGLDPLQPENRAEPQRRVVAECADIGFAFDGDGDRFFTIDDRGEFVAGDFMTALMSRYLLSKYPRQNIIYDVRASWAVPNEVRQAGGTPQMERVGHAFIKRRMAQENALFGGEVTGHYYFRQFYYADSGILPSLVVLELLSRTGQRMSDLLGELERHYFISGEINSTVANARGRMEALAAHYADGQVEWLDGVSVTYPNWHFNVRASNTEPLLRLNLEALDHATMEAKRDELLAIIRG